jgi:hypothetical protein
VIDRHHDAVRFFEAIGVRSLLLDDNTEHVAACRVVDSRPR